MNKQTMYIIGGVALVGLAYYLFKKPTTTPSNSSAFANLSGSGSCSCPTCPTGFTCQQWTTRNGTKKCDCIQELSR